MDLTILENYIVDYEKDIDTFCIYFNERQNRGGNMLKIERALTEDAEEYLDIIYIL